MTRRTPKSIESGVRQRVLDAADHLFYAECVRAVRIDRVLADADAAKASLYLHFGCKDELVAARVVRASNPRFADASNCESSMAVYPIRSSRLGPRSPTECVGFDRLVFELCSHRRQRGQCLRLGQICLRADPKSRRSRMAAMGVLFRFFAVGSDPS